VVISRLQFSKVAAAVQNEPMLVPVLCRKSIERTGREIVTLRVVGRA
jgi:hypothetical protein